MANQFFLSCDVREETTKEKALLRIALFLSNKLRADVKVILESLLEREAVANTALEKGIAIPHIIMNNNAISNVHLAVITFDPPVFDWKCQDETFVDKTLCLVIPQDCNLKMRNIENLTKVFQCLAHEDFIDSLKILSHSKDVIAQIEKIID